MILSLIVAASENNVIGKDNKLPWHLPDDLRRFRSLTKGKTVIMGRKTYESIGHPLPQRRNIVISKSISEIDGCEVFPSLGEVLMRFDLPKYHSEDEVFVIGGTQLFTEALLDALIHLRVDRLYLTRVHAKIDGDVFLPPIDFTQWKEISREEHPKDSEHEFSFTYVNYERVQ